MLKWSKISFTSPK